MNLARFNSIMQLNYNLIDLESGTTFNGFISSN